ncbi:MAG: type II toxin-antitoxin system RelE/ParE family toxin [Sporichthyaceae bacterium]
MRVWSASASGQRPHRSLAGLPGDVPVRSAPVRRFPYRIVYLVHDDAIRVLAVAHTRREPRYWRDRVEPEPGEE